MTSWWQAHSENIKNSIRKHITWLFAANLSFAEKNQIWNFSSAESANLPEQDFVLLVKLCCIFYLFITALKWAASGKPFTQNNSASSSCIGHDITTEARRPLQKPPKTTSKHFQRSFWEAGPSGPVAAGYWPRFLPTDRHLIGSEGHVLSPRAADGTNDIIFKWVFSSPTPAKLFHHSFNKALSRSSSFCRLTLNLSIPAFLLLLALPPSCPICCDGCLSKALLRLPSGLAVCVCVRTVIHTVHSQWLHVLASRTVGLWRCEMNTHQLSADGCGYSQ